MWCWKVVLICLVAHVSVADLKKQEEETSDEEEPPRVIFFVFSGLAVGSILRALVKFLNFPIPFRVLVLFIGGILGILIEVSPYVQKYTHLAQLKPRFLLAAFLPLLMFKTAFCIDSHTFMRSWGQIFLLAVPGLLINACLMGMVMMVLLGHDDWTYAMGLMFGAICSPIYPVEVVSMLREIGQAKHLGILLEGEGMIGDGAVMIMFEILLGVTDENITSWYHVVMVFIRFALGGILLGLVLGKVMGWIMGAIYSDVVNMMISTLVAAYLTYYIGAEILSVSGVIAVVVLGIMASMEKTSLSVEVEEFLLYFWDMLAYIANTMVFLLAGIIIVDRLFQYTTLQEYALVLVTYVVACVVRLLEYILLAPILSRIGYGLTFRNMTIAVWGGLRGPVPFCLALSVFHHAGLSPLGRELLVHVAGLVALTLLINATTMPVLLRLLGLSELSMARKVNMNNCMRHLQNRRDRTISMLKMDRFLADANWPLVNTATVLKHPYKINLSDSDEEEENYLGYRITTCPDCQKEIPSEPTNKEMVEMIREARMRILKAKKISYARQYENGMLSKEAIRVLTQAVEVAMDTEEAVIELDGLHKLFKRQGFVHYTRRKLLAIFFQKSESTVKPPRKYWRRICYHIIMHPAFDIFIYCCIALNVIPIGLEIGMVPKSGSSLSTGLKVANTIFFTIYLLEFILKIYGYSWIYVCRHGFRTYFSSYWNIFDFIILCVAFVDLVMDYLDMFSKRFNKASNRASRVTLVTKLVRVVRLIRLLRLCKAWYPKLIKYCDSKIDKHLAFAYDVGKGYVTGEEEVSDMLIQMVDNKTIREDCRLRMEADRLAVTKELGMVQKDRPWIAITVKTRQAVRATLNSMAEAVLELKVSGWVDDVEYAMLMESLEERLKYVRTKIKSVQPSPPKVMFKEVPWMADDEQISDFLYENVITKVFDQGDVVCADEEMADGVYIIVTGLFKLSYTPKKETLDRLAEYGTLPVIDYIASTRFDEKVEDYIVSGNCVGELSALTGRPYNCTITADTASQAYILTHDVIKQAIQRSPDPVTGLESKMWKSISIRLATSILMDTPAYQSSTQEKIRFQLERAFVPNLSNYKVFGVNDMMEDIILIEGVVFDYNTRDCYTAPCYIPRTVQKIVLPRSSHMHFDTTVETKLLIIPAKDVDEFDIMEREEEISEIVSTASAKCLLHVVQNRASRLKRKRKRQTTFSMGGHRRVKYGDSRLSGSQSVYYSRSRITNASSLETELQNISMYEQEGSNAADSYVINERENRQPTQDRRTSKADRRISTPHRSSVVPSKRPVEESLNVEKGPSAEHNTEAKEQATESSNKDENIPLKADDSKTPTGLKSDDKRIREGSPLGKQGNLEKDFDYSEHRKSDSSKKSVQLQSKDATDKNDKETFINEKRLSNRANSQDVHYINERRKTMTLDDLLRQKRHLSNLRKSEDSGTKDHKILDEIQQIEKEQKSELFTDPKEEIKYRRKSADNRSVDKQQNFNSENVKSEPRQASTGRTLKDLTYLTKEPKEENRRQSEDRRFSRDNRYLDVARESDKQRQSLNRNFLGNVEILNANKRTSKENSHVNKTLNEKQNKSLNDRGGSKDGSYSDERETENQLQRETFFLKNHVSNLNKLQEDDNANQKQKSDVVENANKKYQPEFSGSLQEKKSFQKSENGFPGIQRNIENNNVSMKNDNRKEKQEIQNEFSEKITERKDRAKPDNTDVTNLAEERYNQKSSIDQLALGEQGKTFKSNTEQNTREKRNVSDETEDGRVFPAQSSLAYLRKKSTDANIKKFWEPAEQPKDRKHKTLSQPEDKRGNPEDNKKFEDRQQRKVESFTKSDLSKRPSAISAETDKENGRSFSHDKQTDTVSEDMEEDESPK